MGISLLEKSFPKKAESILKQTKQCVYFNINIGVVYIIWYIFIYKQSRASLKNKTHIIFYYKCSEIYDSIKKQNQTERNMPQTLNKKCNNNIFDVYSYIMRIHIKHLPRDR